MIPQAVQSERNADQKINAEDVCFVTGYFSVGWRRPTGARLPSIRKAIGRAQQESIRFKNARRMCLSKVFSGLETARNPLDRITRMCVGTGGDTDISM
jgi:hypothetical protein